MDWKTFCLTTCWIISFCSSVPLTLPLSWVRMTWLWLYYIVIFLMICEKVVYVDTAGLDVQLDGGERAGTAAPPWPVMRFLDAWGSAGDWDAFNWQLDTMSGRYGRCTFVGAFFCSASGTLGTKTDTLQCPNHFQTSPMANLFIVLQVFQ